MPCDAIGRWISQIEGVPVVLTANPNYSHGNDDDGVSNELFPASTWESVHGEISGWPDYHATPVVALPGLSRQIDVAQICVKDESSRFGIGSFKALGGAYAVFRLVAMALGVDPTELSSSRRALPGAALDRLNAMTVVCATDGNHGRAVAWGAKSVGCRSVIYIHAGVSARREQALRALGADVRRSSGNYDIAVREAADASRKHGWIAVADTSVDESDASPRHVMAGYTLLMTEIAAQLALPPTHVFVQAGVGALAAAVSAGARHFWPKHLPRIVVVEPTTADCVRRSIEAGRPVALSGPLDTVMAGLACGEVSHWAWPVLRSATTHAIAIPDELIAPSMRLVYQSVLGDPRLTLGESGVVGLAALIAARTQPAVGHAVGLDESSRVLLIGTEGVTDPAIYKSLVPEWMGET